jgi:hypothetical protein
MASKPFGAVRRRLGRVIDARVQFAVDRSSVGAASALQRAIDDATESFNVDRKKFAKVEQDELDSLRTLFRELSIGIADQQRAQSALLENLDRRVRKLESSVEAGGTPSEG